MNCGITVCSDVIKFFLQAVKQEIEFTDIELEHIEIKPDFLTPIVIISEVRECLNIKTVMNNSEIESYFL